MKQGRFFVLEGLDGCGKSTQARRLVQRLEASGRTVVHTREPGGTPLGEAVRGILLDPATGEIHPRAEVLLYQVARAQLVEAVIRPALQQGVDVVCERWHYATLAYQTASHAGADQGASEDVVRTSSGLATAGVEPDRAILLALPLETGAERVGADQDRIEARGDAYRRQVAATYARIFAGDAARFRTVTARGSIDEVHARVWEAVADLVEAA